MFKEGNITFNENIDAGILEADGIQHAAVNLRYTGSGVARPGNVCHTFGNNGPKGVQIHKFTVFHAGAESPGGSHDGIFEFYTGYIDFCIHVCSYLCALAHF